MVTYTDKVVLELDAKLAKYHADLLSGQKRFDNVMDDFRKQMKSVESQSVKSFGNMTTALTALGGAMSLWQIKAYTDVWTDFSSRVGLAIRDMEGAPAVMDRLYSMAQRTYTQFGTTAEGFLSFSTSLREVGKTTSESLDFVEAFNNAMVVSGAKAERAAMVQDSLSKAMAMGVLRGDELNTVIQSGGRLAELLAEHFGTTVGGLRKLGEQGKITGDVIDKVLIGNFDKLQKEAESMPATIADGFMRIGNAVMHYIGTMDQATGTSGILAGVLVTVSDNFDLMANSALITAGIIMSQYVPSLVRTAASQALVLATNPFLLIAAAIGTAAGYLYTYSDQIKVIEGDMASLADYSSVAWDYMKEGASIAGDYISDTFNDLSNMITKALEGVGLSWEDVVGFIKDASNKIIGTIYAINKISIEVFQALPAAIAEGIIASMQLMVDLVQAGLNKVVDGINSVITSLQSIPGLGGQIGGTFGAVDLGEIPNPVKGTVREMGNMIGDIIEEAFTTDFVGKGADAASDFLSGWRSRANTKAANNAIAGLNDILTGKGEERTLPSLPPPGESGGKGKGGKGGKKGKGDKDKDDAKKDQEAFQKELKNLADRTAALTAETEAMSKLNPLAEDYQFQLTKMRIEQELLNSAAEKGIKLSPGQKAAIETLATAYATAEQEADKLKAAQDKLVQTRDQLEGIGNDALKGFISDMANGVKAADALNAALGKIGDKLLDMAINNLFGGGGKDGWGIVGGLFGIGGRRARGGPGRKGVPYLVNEETPNSEIFVPSENGGVLNQEQAQRALSKAAQYSQGKEVQPAPTTVLTRAHNTFSFSLEGANGDTAIQQAVQRGIAAAAPLIQKSSVTEAARTVGRMSRTGTKSYMGMG